jgi:hypothetical protein
LSGQKIRDSPEENTGLTLFVPQDIADSIFLKSIKGGKAIAGAGAANLRRNKTLKWERY